MTPGTPELDEGTVAFYRTFFEETNEETNQVFEVVTIDAEGALTTVADTRGEFASFGFRPPSLNKAGDVAIFAELDSGGSGIFVGPDPVADRVIRTGNTLDGAEVTGLNFCEEGLSDSGELAFTATFEDPDTFETRVAVFRAKPSP